MSLISRLCANREYSENKITVKITRSTALIPYIREPHVCSFSSETERREAAAYVWANDEKTDKGLALP